MKNQIVMFLMALTVMLALGADGEGPLQLPESISEAKWLWCGPADNSSETCCFRNEFVIDKPVKRAYFYTFLEGGSNVYVNGKLIALHPWEEFRYYRGHVKGNGAEIATLLQKGKNVLAIGKMKAKTTGFLHRGFILRGEIEFTDGTKKSLVSSAKQFKASGEAPTDWEKLEFNDSDWSPAYEMGDVRKKNWSTYGDVARIYCTPDEYRHYAEMYTHGFPEAKLLQEPETPDVKIIYNKLTLGIRFNGTVLPPYAFSSVDVQTTEGEAMIRKEGDAGIQFYVISVNDQTCGAGIGHYDFCTLDLTVRRLLAMNPEAKIIFSYRGTPLTEWLNKNPDECQGYAIERNDPKLAHWTYWNNPLANSIASQKYREEVLGGFVRALAEFSLKQPWGRRVVALQLQYGGSGDGMPYGCHSMPDTGKRMTEAFRRFLTEKYSNDAALQKAWNDAEVTLQTATVPDQNQRLGSGTYIRNAGDPRDRRLADFYTCYHREFSDMVESFGKAVKRYFPGRLAGAFHGYVILGYTPEGSTANFEPLLASPYIDYLNGTTLGYNLTDGLHRIMSYPLRKHGMLTSIEADIRTHLGGEGQWRCKTPDETRSTISKVIGNSLFNGCSYHLVDFGKEQKWALCDEMLEPIQRSIPLWKKFFKTPLENASDTLVVVDPNQIWMQGSAVLDQNIPMAHGSINHTQQTLTFSGFSFDWMTLDDYLEENKPYQAVIFLNQYSIPREKQARLLEKLRKPGVTAIWNGAPGIASDNGYSDVTMKELTGLTLKYKMEKSHFIAKQTNGRPLTLFINGRKWEASPRVFAEEQDADVLALYDDDKTAALIRKNLPDGSTAVFSGIPINDSLLWAELLGKAGCHAFTDTGFFVRRNSKLLMVYSGKGGRIAPESNASKAFISQSGKAVVTLEKEAKRVTDLFTDTIIAENVKEFTLSSETPHTWLLEIE